MLMAVAVLGGGSAMAFPTWMGVYGTTVRHADGQNPGTYMIMMNQDYVGLHAEVGVQVNGGAWQVYSMSYLNRTDNNSVCAVHAGPGLPGRRDRELLLARL